MVVGTKKTKKKQKTVQLVNSKTFCNKYYRDQFPRAQTCKSGTTEIEQTFKGTTLPWIGRVGLSLGTYSECQMMSLSRCMLYTHTSSGEDQEGNAHHSWCLLEDDKGMLQPNQISTLVQDRRSWKKPAPLCSSFLTNVQHLLGVDEGMLRPSQISTLAQDHHSWKNL